MNLARALILRLLDAVDALFDAAASILRVLIRGAFRPDAKDYRSGRFARLTSGDVFIQTVAINAADDGQARRIIRLDPERYLPLAESAASFDVIGPLPADDRPRAQPEQDFLLGVVRRDKLAAFREDNKRRAATIEGFVFEPPDHPGAAFLFRDELGERRRRFRRGVTAFAIAALAWTAYDAAQAWRAHLESAVARAESERVLAQREIRLHARRLAEARAARRALSTEAGAPLGELNERLAILARRLPAQTELRRVEWSSSRLELAGVSFAPNEMELELRRAFQGADIAFETVEPGPPDAFAAAIAWPRNAEARR